MYRPLVRPHLEYAASIWNPHLVKETNQMGSSKVCTDNCPEKVGLQLS